MFLCGYHSDIIVLLWFTRERSDFFLIPIIHIVLVSLFKIKLKKYIFHENFNLIVQRNTESKNQK